ncbi:MAG: helix-turn-helix domain-containing protein [Gemmatimonadaceae bacterium]
MRTSPFPSMECPIARSVAQMGDAWRVLILRDALLGFRRFDEFETGLGIAPNILAKRLSGLVADGLLTKRAYQQRPVRYEYEPTPKARDFQLVIAALATWGTKWLSPKGATVALVDKESGELLESAVVGQTSRRVFSRDDIRFIPGPKAGPEILKRASRLRARKEKSS